MSKFLVKCYDGEAEIVSSQADADKLVEFAFDTKLHGHVCIEGFSTSIDGAVCTLDVSRLPDGVYTPRLVLNGRSIALPEIKKINDVVIPQDYSLTHLRILSMRCGILNDRIAELERRMKSTEEKVFGRGILG